MNIVVRAAFVRYFSSDGPLMAEPVAYLNGQYVPASQLLIPATDLGFVQGVTVAEQLRTFGGKLFRLDRHLERLWRSLKIIGVDPGRSSDEFRRVADELIARNFPAVDNGGDLGLSMFVTPGTYGTFAAAGVASGPTVGLHTYPLPFHAWASKYETGESLAVTSIEQVPTRCWPAELKCRSRIHYYLADKEARQLFPGARALMVDEKDFATEASTANLLIFNKKEGLVSPPKEKILPGVTVAALQELAEGLGIRFTYREVTVANVAAADEVVLCSTSPCVWSVTMLNGKPIGSGKPGSLVAQLQQAWSAMVGFDIVAQARRCSGVAVVSSTP